ncbi:MAG: COX15/CtaA family protein [Bryobacterales bacterium]|nr:COX15/CtaA family protein [Bryobacterales bacterium]
MSPFSRYAYAVLWYNILVVCWGALVRATGSGAGCGEHWPLCNGSVVPAFPQAHTIIEFTHRITSGFALISVVVLYLRARRAFDKSAPARRAAFYALIFMINETLIGALLVLLGLVAGSRSPWRAAVLAVHLVNTLLLLAAIALAAWWSARTPSGASSPLSKQLRWATVAIIVISALGGIAALGDTLFPAASLSDGVREEFSRSAPLLVRLRVLHPVAAFLGGAFLLWIASKAQSLYRDPQVLRYAAAIQLLTFAQFVLGAVNIFLLTPLWTQLTHLLLTDLLWVSLVLLSASVMAARPQPS